MSRLTHYDAKQKQYIRLASRLAVDNKLGKLEDLEEQLGCPLEVVFKALGHWIYDEDGNAWYIEHYYQECNVYQLHSVRHFGRIADKKFNTKDYKKTWWLKKNREE